MHYKLRFTFVVCFLAVASSCSDTPTPVEVPPSLEQAPAVPPPTSTPPILPAPKEGETIRDGLFTDRYPSGAVRLEATYKQGILHGRYRRFTTKGLLLEEAYFADGKLDGLRKLYSATGALVQLSRYRDGLLNGETRVLFPNGKSKTTGVFYNVRIKGELKAYYPNGKVNWFCSFRDGLLDGLVKTYTSSGRLIEEVQFDEATGKGVSRSFNDSVKLVVEFEYVSPRRDAATPENWGFFGFEQQGENEVFRELGGAVERRVFESREKDGVFKEFNSDGTLKRSCTFDKGQARDCKAAGS